jgi:outer membrane protein W
MQKTEMEKAMNRQIRFRGRIIFACLCIGIVLFCAQESLAQFDRISVSVSGGAGHLPLKEWEDFATSNSSDHFDRDRFGSYLDFRIAYYLTEKHVIALNVEDLKTFASVCGVMTLTGPTGDTLGYACSLHEWDFSAIPIGLSYEFHPTGSEEKVSPFLGVGASYFFSKVKGKSWFLHDGRFENLSSGVTRDGEGCGLHLYVGVQSKLTKHLLIFSRLRGRYADGMAFTDKKGDIKVEFTGVDFTLGLGWRF